MSPELFRAVSLAIIFSVVDSLAMAIKKIRPNLFVPIFLVGQIGTAAISADIPVALGIGLGGAKHIWNTFFAACLLREPVDRMHIAAVVVIFSGIVVCSTFAFKPTEQEVWRADKIYRLYLQKEFFVLHLVNLCFAAWSLTKIWSEGLLQKSKKGRAGAIPLLLLSNITSGYSCQTVRALSGQLQHVLSIVVVSTDGGGVLTKILQPWALGSDEHRELLCVCFLLVFLLPFAIWSLWFLDRALMLYPALFVTTGTQCMAGVWQLVNGMVLFREWESYSATMFLGTVSGIGLQLLGVGMNYVASQRLEGPTSNKQAKKAA